MIRDAIAVVAFVVFAVSPAGAQVRLEGLDRLYFERFAGPGGQLPASEPSQKVAFLIPEALAKPEFASGTSRAVEPDGELLVRDFELPLRSIKHRVWIRELLDVSHPRISKLWWALYDHGRRSDVWYFEASPDRMDDKMLSNYRLDSLSTPEKSHVVFRVQGEMFRPGGAWWVVGKEFVFRTSASAITFAHVRNAFAYFHSYDTDSSGGVLSVSTENEVNGRFETREIDPVSESSAGVCGFRDPVLAEDWEFSWQQLDNAARCIVSERGAVIGHRDLRAASFVERAGSSAKRDR